jgi:hypothetical protein
MRQVGRAIHPELVKLVAKDAVEQRRKRKHQLTNRYPILLGSSPWPPHREPRYALRSDDTDVD